MWLQPLCNLRTKHSMIWTSCRLLAVACKFAAAFVDPSEDSRLVQESIGQFVSTRQLAGHPITISHYTSWTLKNEVFLFLSHLCLGVIYLPAAILLDFEISVTVFSYSNITMIGLIWLCRIEVNIFRTRSSSTDHVLDPQVYGSPTSWPIRGKGNYWTLTNADVFP
jgi:hypothetical protein